MNKDLITIEDSKILKKYIEDNGLSSEDFLNYISEVYLDNSNQDEEYQNTVLAAINEKLMSYNESYMNTFFDYLSAGKKEDGVEQNIMIKLEGKKDYSYYIDKNKELESEKISLQVRKQELIEQGEKSKDIKDIEEKIEILQNQIETNKNELSDILKETIFAEENISDVLQTYPLALKNSVRRYVNAILNMEEVEEMLKTLSKDDGNYTAVFEEFLSYSFAISNPYLSGEEYSNAYREYAKTKYSDDNNKTKISGRTNISRTEGFKPMAPAKDYKPMD